MAHSLTDAIDIFFNENFVIFLVSNKKACVWQKSPIPSEAIENWWITAYVTRILNAQDSKNDYQMKFIQDI